MTWPKIKTVLFRRFSEVFYMDAQTGELALIRNGRALAFDSLSDICEISRAVGAEVWSTPSRYRRGWYIGHYDGARSFGAAGEHKSRESAELAALGEWLKATEVNNG